MQKFKLINNFDGNDVIEFEVDTFENPETVALTELGWYVVGPEEEESSEESE
jgi:hypothetical protein